ncbi:unnamed protein product, partial [Iphiclides podalirius]
MRTAISNSSGRRESRMQSGRFNDSETTRQDAGNCISLELLAADLATGEEWAGGADLRPARWADSGRAVVNHRRLSAIAIWQRLGNVLAAAESRQRRARVMGPLSLTVSNN